jgi:hypothetical protein
VFIIDGGRSLGFTHVMVGWNGAPPREFIGALIDGWVLIEAEIAALGPLGILTGEGKGAPEAALAFTSP